MDLSALATSKSSLALQPLHERGQPKPQGEAGFRNALAAEVAAAAAVILSAYSRVCGMAGRAALPWNQPSYKRILDLDNEGRHAIFVSHSRRDPAALNAAYALIDAWRRGKDPDTGLPFCASTYTCDGNNTVVLWLDKEQMSESGGDDWGTILTQAQKVATLAVFMLGNGYVSSAECVKEFKFGDMKKFI